MIIVVVFSGGFSSLFFFFFFVASFVLFSIYFSFFVVVFQFLRINARNFTVVTASKSRIFSGSFETIDRVCFMCFTLVVLNLL